MTSRRNTKWLAFTSIVMTFVLVLSACAQAEPESKGTIHLQDGDFTGNNVDVKLVEIILSEHMGYEVETTFLSMGPEGWVAIAGGEIDISMEYWPSYAPEMSEYLTEFGGDGTVAYLEPLGIVGESGIFVPRYIIEGDAERGIEASAPDLKTWEDLNAYKDIFSSPETGDKGRFLACPVVAWACDDEGDEGRVAGLGWEFEPVLLGSEAAHWAELDAAYSRGDPILIYAWEPHWVHAKYDLVSIELPEWSEEAWPATGWPTDLTFAIGSLRLVEEFPEVAQFVKNFDLSNDQQAGMILAVDIDGETVEDAVRAWMAENEDIWMAWIP